MSVDIADPVVWTESPAPASAPPVKAEAVYGGLRLTVEVSNGHATVNVWCQIAGCDVLAYEYVRATLSEAKLAAVAAADRLLAAGAVAR